MTTISTSRLFAIVFWTIGAAFLAYVFARAWLIPVTHDEAYTTYLMSTLRASQLIFYDYVAPQPNNHVLNSIFIKTWTGIWGLSPLTLRFANLLAGALYLWCGYLLLSRFFQNDLFRIVGAIVWLANPYMLEFFSLARGYGLSAALESGAVVYGALYLNAKPDDASRLKNLKAAFTFAALSVIANFTAINFYLCFVGLMTFVIFREPSPRRKLELKTLLVTTGLLVLLIFNPLKKIKAIGGFSFFGSKGFLEDTVRSFSDCLLMGKKYFGEATPNAIQWFLVGITFIVLITVIWKFARAGWKITPLVWLLALLPGVVIVNLLASKFAGASYLTTRTTILFYPLLACAILALSQMLLEYSPRLFWGLGMIVPAFLAINFFSNANFRDAYEWDYDRDTYTVLNFIEKTYDAESRTAPYSLRCHCLQHPSFKFYIDWMKSPRYTRVVAPDVQEVPCTISSPVDNNVDFYYVPDKQLEHFRAGYDVVLELSAANEKRVLLRKKG